MTLHGLTGHGDAAQMMDATRAGGIRIFETVARRGADGPVLLWQGDAEYHLDGAAPPDGRHRLEIGVLP